LATERSSAGRRAWRLPRRQRDAAVQAGVRTISVARGVSRRRRNQSPRWVWRGPRSRGDGSYAEGREIDPHPRHTSLYGTCVPELGRSDL